MEDMFGKSVMIQTRFVSGFAQTMIVFPRLKKIVSNSILRFID